MEANNGANKALLATQPNPVALLGAASNLCYVCKEKAGKHNYYGGRVCPSCRAFFRRAVQSKYYEIFFCTKGEKCEINLTTRYWNGFDILVGLFVAFCLVDLICN